MGEFLNNVNKFFDGTFNLYLSIVIMILILFTGILLTIRQKCIQVTKFAYSLTMTIGKTVKSIKISSKEERLAHKKNKHRISPFAAFSAAVSGTVGTGNIVGVTTALMLGGAGAIFWMWFSAFFGMVTNYTENMLGIYYRDKDEAGEYRGGVMYYIVRGLGKSFKWLAVVFAVCAVLASIGFNFVQSNSISNTVASAFNTTGNAFFIVTLVVGILLAVLAALIIIGGIKRISTVTSYLVPFMAVFYIILALIVIFMNVTHVGDAFASIFKGAFSTKAVGSGILGYTIMRAMRYGIARGIFSNEAGLGSSVMAHSSAHVKEPVEQGLWGIFEVFLDTFIICTLTALVILTTGVLGDLSTTTAASKAMLAFSSNLGVFGTVAFTIILPIFAFTTLISWSYYGEKAIEYLFGFKSKKYFRIVYVVLVIVGAIVGAELVWTIADTFNYFMAIPNLVALIMLSGTIVKITSNYFQRRKGADIEPMLSYDPEVNEVLKNETLAEMFPEDQDEVIAE